MSNNQPLHVYLGWGPDFQAAHVMELLRISGALNRAGMLITEADEDVAAINEAAAILTTMAYTLMGEIFPDRDAMENHANRLEQQTK